MHYYPEDQTVPNLQKIQRENVCAECGRKLSIYFNAPDKRKYIACSGQLHEGIAKVYKPPIDDYQSKIRRSMELEDEHGREKSIALSKYVGTTTMTKSIATEIVESLWGDAPTIEKTKCILLCQTYQLNPLRKHIYLIGYKQYKDRKLVVDGQGKPILDWSIQQGIGATRLLAQRKHNFSYLDMTPRKATKEEIEKIFGDTANPNSLYAFVHIKDNDTGAECTACRGIPKDYNVKGLEKGNTLLNQVCIWTERLALDRQYPGEMPPNIEVIDEAYAELPEISGDIIESTGEIVEAEVRELPLEPEDELFPPDAEVELESEPETVVKVVDQTAITAKQIEHVQKLMADCDPPMDIAAMGKWCVNEKQWNGLRGLSGLEKWQYDEIVTAFEKGKE